jgi:hypothetical protein
METISKRGAMANSMPICDLYAMAADLEIMLLKVRLLGISPMIWRRVLAEASTSLEELHSMLQVAMGWEGFWTCPDKVESGFLEFAKEHIHDREDQERRRASEAI